MKSDPVVSIICNAYNQEQYIQDALESFLAQKTSFEFEVLVHDDASTDSTAQIIRKYEEKYPEIIKPIYQKENKYSKGISIDLMYQYPRVRGKYVAICEGDDYFVSEEKLQKQYEVLEELNDVDMCSHAALKVHESTKKVLGRVMPQGNSGVLTIENVIKGGGGFIATNTIMMRRCLVESIPKFRKNFMYDYSLQIHGALRGGIYYDEKIMSAYRICAKNSWTEKMKKNHLKRLEINKEIEQMLCALNQETNYIYSAAIQERLVRVHADALLCAGKYLSLLKPANKKLLATLNLKEKMILLLRVFFPFLRS